MMVNVSPAAENAGETKCSLEFASRARKVELGRARQNLESPTVAGLRMGSAGGSRNGSQGSTPGNMSRVGSSNTLRPPAAR
eukprot:322941-Chlamydomonas_euryale.AAC.3